VKLFTTTPQLSDTHPTRFSDLCTRRLSDKEPRPSCSLLSVHSLDLGSIHIHTRLKCKMAAGAAYV
jgi:hypothetical protein